MREMLSQALAQASIEIVSKLALPIQSRALTYLLNVPETEADTWIGWGIHVFKVTGGEFKKGIVLEDYLHAQFDRAEANPGEDLFSALTTATYRGRLLTREEKMGLATSSLRRARHDHSQHLLHHRLPGAEPRGLGVSAGGP